MEGSTAEGYTAEGSTAEACLAEVEGYSEEAERAERDRYHCVQPEYYLRWGQQLERAR